MAAESKGGQRILVTGVGTFWGGRTAQVIEQDPSVEVIVGLDTRAPTVPLERTEVVRADSSYSILSRLVRATEVDTIRRTELKTMPQPRVAVDRVGTGAGDGGSGSGGTGGGAN